MCMLCSYMARDVLVVHPWWYGSITYCETLFYSEPLFSHYDISNSVDFLPFY